MLQRLPSFNLHIIPMATTNLSLFFLIFSPMIFLQLHARESQFFSKFSNHNPIDDELLPTTIQPQQQDQKFIPQTTDSTGYGLYGHLPPSTTSLSVTNLPENYNTVAYTTPVQSKDSLDTNTDPQYASKTQFNGDSSMYMNHEKQDKFYDHLPNSLTTNGGAYDNYNTVAYTTPIHSENSYGTTTTKYGNKDQYNGDSSMYNSQKQGMSDTRYMENGKYYYDLNSQSSNPRVFDLRNGYNTRGYYGNDDNSYDRYNSNARFQENQEDDVFTP
ncbi:hypothetical protein L6452_30982 [Arctium lappa]|uniref:Uncharacterized protein n=1 Tax=Arctium lappa TaxID=4217 RepID=A0ACB8ZIP8_ARCLA|nr:hypothetical protein L6452_30982 [Arctium lappa]